MTTTTITSPIKESRTSGWVKRVHRAWKEYWLLRSLRAGVREAERGETKPFTSVYDLLK